jgi:uncharacterized protein with ParB-like and HNH nuclease domain
MNITPKNANIRALFQANFYKVPRFQRPYSWDKANIEDFWKDAIEDGSPGYFIGSMVLYGVAASEEVSIVDGQQRLTTITIFLAALRDAFQKAGEPQLARGVQTIIQRRDFKDVLRYVLKTETSYPYFQEYIQKLEAPEIEIVPGDEEKGLDAAYQYAVKQLETIVSEAESTKRTKSAKKAAVKKRLERVRELLLALDVVVVQLDNEDDAYIVFETLNTRGKDLEPKDLIKNYLTRMLPPKNPEVDATKLKWTKWLTELASSAVSIDPSMYLHHFWLSRHEYVSEKTLYKGVKTRIKKANASEFLNQIVSDVDLYRRIFEPDNFPWKNEQRSLKDALLALGIFKVRQPTPMVLSLLRAYFAKRISLKQAKDTLQAIERFHFLFTAIAGVSSSGGVSMMYAAGARTLTNETSPQKRGLHLGEFRKKLLDRVPELDIFNAGFMELKYSQVENRRRALIHYILRKVDGRLRTTDAPVDYTKMTIEHIAPQNPPKGVDKLEEYADIGNLILVGSELNQQLTNASFADKIKLMKKAGVPLDPVLEAATAWGSDEIVARTELLAGYVFQT